MRTVQRDLSLALATVLGMLSSLEATVGLGATGWTVGLGAGGVLHGWFAYAVVRRGAAGGTLADRVTGVRASLSAVAAALVAEGLTGSGGSTAVLVGVAGLALVLDRVDGEVARRTGHETDLGARYDMEVDAFLVLVLSVSVAAFLGPWVLVIGAARYLLLLATPAWPWLARPTPARWWAKVVAAVQGVVLTVVTSGLLPPRVSTVLVLAALLLLAESFLHQVRWLARHRPASVAGPVGGGHRTAGRGADGAALTALAVLLLWAVLTAPDDLTELGPTSVLRVPLEGVVLAGLLAVLPATAARAVAVAVGLVLSGVLVLKGLDLGYRLVLNRPFDPLVDWRYLDSAVGVVDSSAGRVAAVAASVAAVLLVMLVAAALPAALTRVGRLLRARRRSTVRVVVPLLLVWAVGAGLGAGTTVAGRVAVAPTTSYAVEQVVRIPGELEDRREFARAAAEDPLAGVAADRLVHGLAGLDVLLVFVESLGRVALTDPALSARVGEVLDTGTTTLRAAGFRIRSAWLTSPTFGAVSWLAHATVQSGLWVSDQLRYDVLMRSRRLTLTRIFGAAGWRTVSVVPANTRDWPDGRGFYGFDELYDSRNVGYRGPRFGYPTMPDQFTLHALHDLELSDPSRRPVFAEVDLVSSHAPWSRTPELVDPDLVGDGSVFDGMPERSASEAEVWQSADRVRAAYAEALAYSLRALFSFVERHGTERTVVVMLGDHQPSTVVAGDDAGHDVPVALIAQDPRVLRRTSAWGWGSGLRPGPSAPVWRMDAFRDRFLAASARPGAVAGAD